MSQTIYPIGIQNFEKIRKDGYLYLYIDKTALVYQLVTTGQYYFLSRPPTLREKPVAVHAGGLFPRGKKELFEGLAMEKLEKDWKEYPILHFDLNISQYDSPDSLYKILKRHPVPVRRRIWDTSLGSDPAPSVSPESSTGPTAKPDKGP